MQILWRSKAVISFLCCFSVLCVNYNDRFGKKLSNANNFYLSPSPFLLVKIQPHHPFAPILTSHLLFLFCPLSPHTSLPPSLSCHLSSVVYQYMLDLQTDVTSPGTLFIVLSVLPHQLVSFSLYHSLPFIIKKPVANVLIF